MIRLNLSITQTRSLLLALERLSDLPYNDMVIVSEIRDQLEHQLENE